MSQSAQFLSPEQRAILRKSALCAKLSEDQAEYFFEVVERVQLDPFTGQIRPDIRMSKVEGSSEKMPTLLIITTLQGLRVIGDRTGELEGEAPWEWCNKEGVWREVWLEQDMPVAARAVTYRKNRKPQIAVVRWDAVVQLTYNRNGQTEPNKFWNRMGSHMLAKCAQAASYRGAFPAPCSRLYISEEISDQLDPDSEEAIEAEMIRRARTEKAYWEKERAKGNFPAGETPPAPPPDAAPAAPKKPVERAPAPPAQPQLDLPKVNSVNDRLPWNDFVIKRIQFFAGRTVGSLTQTELQGLKPWLEKVSNAWNNLDDEDLKRHHTAIQAAIDHAYQKEIEALSDGLDFTPSTK